MRRITKDRINRIRYHKSGGLNIEKYGKSANINDYTDQEIIEMIHGVYKDKKFLCVDGDYFIDMNDVSAILCELDTVTYHKNPNLKEYRTNTHNNIKNIKTFYVKNYFLITK